MTALKERQIEEKYGENVVKKKMSIDERERGKWKRTSESEVPKRIAPSTDEATKVDAARSLTLEVVMAKSGEQLCRQCR